MDTQPANFMLARSKKCSLVQPQFSFPTLCEFKCNVISGWILSLSSVNIDNQYLEQTRHTLNSLSPPSTLLCSLIVGLRKHGILKNNKGALATRG